MIKAAAILGTLAVLLATLELSPIKLPHINVEEFEVTTAILAAGAVILGLLLHFKDDWILDRVKAERFRLLKFGFIIDPDSWCPGEQCERYEQLKTDATSVDKMRAKNFDDWLKRELVTESRVLKTDCEIHSESLRAVVDYYLKTRLEKQMHYFELRMAQQQSRKNKWYRKILPWFFFGSVAVTLVHFIAKRLDWGKEDIIVVFLFLAAALPALSAGIRTCRSAHEYARNAMRYEAKLLALRHFEKRLVRKGAKQELDVHRIFHALWCCEQIFEFEHREWLRLMLEAEWYG
jgi:hypothetical protein